MFLCWCVRELPHEQHKSFASLSVLACPLNLLESSTPPSVDGFGDYPASKNASANGYGDHSTAPNGVYGDYPTVRATAMNAPGGSRAYAPPSKNVPTTLNISPMRGQTLDGSTSSYGVRGVPSLPKMSGPDVVL